MEFIRQLVAFAAMMEEGQGLLNKSPETIEDAWIIAANATSELELLDRMSPGERQRYQAWLDNWITGLPAAPQEAPTEPEPEEEMFEDTEGAKRLAEEVLRSVTPKKRRGKHESDDKT